MKVVDAEKLIAEIERREIILDKYEDSFETAACCKQELVWMKDLINSFQQEQPEVQNGKFVFPKYLYARTVDNKTIDVSYAPQSLDAVEYIKNDHIEQTEVDLEKEIEKYFKGWTETDDGIACHYQYVDLNTCRSIARHFYELRELNARKR